MSAFDDTSRVSRRKSLGAIGGAVVAALGFGNWLRNRPEPLEELAQALGFKRYSSGNVTAAFDPFIGLDRGEDPLRPTDAVRQRVVEAPCAVLFDQPEPGVVPLGVFTDFLCPICRRFEAELEEHVADTSDLAPIRWLDLPRLGEGSVIAARLALAARRQGVEQDMRGALKRTPIAGPGLRIDTLATRIGVDEMRLNSNYQSAEVTKELQEIRAIADALGVVGTPSFVLGGTVVIGAIDMRRFDQLIRDASPAPCL